MMRATMSAELPAGKPTNKRTGRVGYVCAHASRETAGSIAAPAAKCRNWRRGSFMALPLFKQRAIWLGLAQLCRRRLLKPPTIQNIGFQSAFLLTAQGLISRSLHSSYKLG